MPKPLTDKQLMDLLAEKARVSVPTAKKVWECMLDIIYEELLVTGKLTIKNFATITAVDMPAGTWVDPNGVVHRVPRHSVIRYKSMVRFKNYVNGRVTRYGKKRVKKYDPTDPENIKLQKRKAERTVEALLRYKHEHGENISDVVGGSKGLSPELQELLEIDDDVYEEDGTIL